DLVGDVDIAASRVARLRSFGRRDRKPLSLPEPVERLPEADSLGAASVRSRRARQADPVGPLARRGARRVAEAPDPGHLDGLADLHRGRAGPDLALGEGAHPADVTRRATGPVALPTAEP